MKKPIYLILATFLISTQTYAQESIHSKKSTRYIVSLEDLYYCGENIFIEIEGNVKSVQSLQRHGDSWMVDAASFCSSGHKHCDKCGLCHVKKCINYVTPCWK